ncbi:hypothetical protein OESDEN_12032 [Oesophagostomum dentatum]|uniref:Uncharacterized protein n=1 Tax=Oesophagostomum dentatum TaxID=61180 RepID=A0A0B1SSC3_OESDE|nr:hypothetical protein OESDEN_12032 [Oesophagostomum dentatum]
MDHNRSFVYDAQPLVVLPERQISARCSKWRQTKAKHSSPMLFDDDVIVVENDDTRLWSQKSFRSSEGEEALDAYFSDHPFLDFAGRCGSIGIVAILLYNIYAWYASLLQCNKG